MLAWDSNRSICQYLAVLVNIQISWAIFGHQDSRPLSRQLPIAVKAVFSCMHSSVNEIYLLVEKWSQQTFLCRKEKYDDCTRIFTFTKLQWEHLNCTLYITLIAVCMYLRLKRFCPRQHWGDVNPCESQNLWRQGSQWAWDLEKSFDENHME